MDTGIPPGIELLGFSRLLALQLEEVMGMRMFLFRYRKGILNAVFFRHFRGHLTWC